MEVLFILIGVVALVVGILVFRKKKKKPEPSPTPSPAPTQRPPSYTYFLQNVETVIRNNLSEGELASYFASIKNQYESHKYESGFIPKFNELLAKYSIPFPY